MRKVLPFLLSLLIFQPVFSQQNEVLKNFKYRIENYTAISFFGGSGANYTSLNYSADKNRGSGNSTSISGNYYQLKSTDKIYRSISAFLGANTNHSRSKSISSNYKNRNFSIAEGFNFSNTWFERNFFLELGTQLSTRYSKEKATNSGTNLQNKRYTAKPWSALVTITAGTGRIENIRDMQNALWLYKTLQDENILSRTLTDVELNNLGQTVTKANNTRIVDARRRLRFSLETVDSFFQKNGLVKNNDIKYFSALNDILFFAINNPRFSGTQKYIIVTPIINAINNNEEDFLLNGKSVTKENIKSIRGEAGFRMYKPVNLKHQNNYFINALYEYIDRKNIEREYTNGIQNSYFETVALVKKAGVKLGYEHAIYPTTRTSFILGLESESGYQKVNLNDDFYTNIVADGTMNYFISYKTVLSANIRAFYQKNHYYAYLFPSLQPDGFQASFNVGLNINL